VTVAELLPVVLVALAALLAPWLAGRLRRLRVPVAVVEILLGLMLGRAGLHLLRTTPALNFLSLFGLSYLMFLSGLEIDVTGLGSEPGRKSGVLHTLLFALAGVVIGSLATVWLGSSGFHTSPLTLGLLLVAGSPTVVLPVLKEHRLERTRFGQVVLRATVLADFVSLTGITVLVAFRTGGSLRLVLAFLLFIPFALLLRYAQPIRALWARQRRDFVTGPMDVRGVLFLITVFIAMAEALGTATVLGAFLAGLVVSALLGQAGDVLQSKLDTLGYGYFVPFFFVMLGAGVTFPAAISLSHLVGLVALLLASSFAVSFLPSLLFLPLLGPRATLAAGLLLSSRLSATLAGATVLAGAGLLPRPAFVAVVLMALVSALLFPSLSLPIAPHPEPERERYLLLGDDPLVDHLASSLAGRGLAVEREPGREASILGLFYRSRADLTAALARLSGPWQRVVVEVEPDDVGWARSEGYIPFVPRLAPLTLAEALLTAPHGAALLAGTSDANAIADIPLQNPALWGRALKEVSLPPGVLVVSVSRGADRIVPRGATRLEPGDVLTVVAPVELMASVRARLSP
jgi:CPA2 family monovalent cation:H+ antiporter-2